MKKYLSPRNLWLPAALATMLAPPLLNAALNLAAPAPSEVRTDHLGHSSGRSKLPAMLPVQLDTSVLSAAHQVVNHHVYLSTYRSMLGSHDDGLVPYIPRLYNLDTFTQTQQIERRVNNTTYTKAIYRKKYSRQTYVAYYQYRIGRISTESYTKAKLYQLPAAFMGAQDFNLIIWQQACEQASCDRESQNIEELLARQAS